MIEVEVKDKINSFNEIEKKLEKIGAIKSKKELVIYPTYLVDVFLNWVDDSLAYLLASTGFLAILFVVVTALTWRLKNNSEQ